LPVRHPSAIKRHRQNLKRRTRNKTIRSHVRTDVRKLREAVASGDVATAQTQLRIAVRELYKAVSKGVLHRNAAARRVARLTKHVGTIKSAS
jgi:small subunit ribosomal protein S20